MDDAADFARTFLYTSLNRGIDKEINAWAMPQVLLAHLCILLSIGALIYFFLVTHSLFGSENDKEREKSKRNRKTTTDTERHRLSSNGGERERGRTRGRGRERERKRLRVSS